MWPFRKRRKSPAPPEDWRTGNLAECIRDDWLDVPVHKLPRRGSRMIVNRLVPGWHKGVTPGWALSLIGYPGLWDATAFRKVPPAFDMEGRGDSVPPVRVDA